MPKPRIAIPVPTSTDFEYNHRSWGQYAAAVERSGGEPVEVPLNQPPAATAKLIANCQGILLPGSGADVNPQKYGQQPEPECNPADLARENVDELLLQDAHNMGKPILAICFGAQMLNVWRGGTLVQHLAPMPINHQAGRTVGVAHPAAVAPNSLLAEIVASDLEPRTSPLVIPEGNPLSSSFVIPEGNPLSSFPRTPNLEPRLPINSSHHQAIGIPGDGLRVSARSPEDGVVEAVEGTPEGVGGNFVLGVQWHPERTFEESAASRALFSRFISEAAAWSPKPASTATQ
jgi:putative glutamine amidotransferase